MSFRRRALIGAAAGIPLLACASPGEDLLGVVALPERSLAYTPLIAAVKSGLYQASPRRVAVTQQSGGRRVADAVTEGFADAGALSLPDFLAAVAKGAPLVAIGALTKRHASQLVVSTSLPVAERSLAAVLDGTRKDVRVGVETGGDGTASFAHSLVLGSSLSRSQEPQWIAFPTSEALVAALADNRVEAYFGRPYATAHSASLGNVVIAENFAAGERFEPQARAFSTVVVTRRDRAPNDDRVHHLLSLLMPACARAATVLSSDAGPDLAVALLPDRDGLALRMATRLAAPSPATSCFAQDAQLSIEAAEAYLELAALAGTPLNVDVRTLVLDRYSG
ncbi:MAG TPA: ABC transporter substrate-binding protein [Chloroflexota bacterium]|nr:ABC transporter substrate-binding protein [Chloroflexota bacterium]